MDIDIKKIGFVKVVEAAGKFVTECVRNSPSDGFDVNYYTTSNRDYCKVYGIFRACNNCMDYIDNACTARR